MSDLSLVPPKKDVPCLCTEQFFLGILALFRKNVEIPILKSSARIAARLNYLCPQFFPAPGFWSLTHLKNSRPDSILSGEVCLDILCS